VQPGNTAGPFDGGDDMQQELVNTASGDALRCPSLAGAGAKQEQRLFRDLPELLSTVADGPCTVPKLEMGLLAWDFSHGIRLLGGTC
jgi:hypothetical protein